MSSINDLKPSNDDLQDDKISLKESSNKKVIRVGSRKSELALVQTNHVISLLKKLYPHQKFEIHKMTTVGDRVLNISLPKIGEKSLFTKDLEDALRKGDVDFVVHSLKDLPTALPDGMVIGAVLEREDPRDSLVLAKQHDGKCFKTLPEGSIIGTSSLRRIAQISRLYPHLKVHDIRGNLNTRLAKLDANDSKYAGIVLAQAGLVRLGWQKRVNHIIEPEEILYAVGQGALAVECRSSDTHILGMLQRLVCHQTQCRILAERSFLKTLGGGCSAPVAVHSILTQKNHIEIVDGEKNAQNNYELRIIGSVWSLDGKTEIQAENQCDLDFSVKRSIKNDDEETVPSKKQKLSIEINDDDDIDNIKNSSKSDTPSPPQVIDHSKLDFKTANDLNENLDIAAIMNVHNDVFKKCPYSSFVQANHTIEVKAQTASVCGDQPLKCPLNFPVGEDVMGQCPYFDNINENDSLTKSLTEHVGCPFKNDATSNQINLNVSNENTTKTPIDVTKCPFLNPIPSSSKTTNTSSTNHSNNVLNECAIEPLFCGIYPHYCWPLKVFEKCEQLGKELASNLIEKGALTVMECAQHEIRSKT